MPSASGYPVRLLAVFTTLSVAILSLTPRISLPSSAPAMTDLVLHFLMHGSMAGLIALGWPQRPWTVTAIVLALAIGFELAQYIIPGRSFSLEDMGMNLAGAVIGFTLARRLNGLVTKDFR